MEIKKRTVMTTAKNLLPKDPKDLYRVEVEFYIDLKQQYDKACNDLQSIRKYVDHQEQLGKISDLAKQLKKQRQKVERLREKYNL